jgi:predicted AAA+ superfamily ATPase
MVSRLLSPIIQKSKKSILLLGPRQTGKSTLIRGLKPELQINLADESTFLEFSANASELNERLAARYVSTIMIDEIQRIPSLLNTIQAVIDEAKPGKCPRFFLTGSSARKLRRGGANLLPGRVLAFHMSGLLAQELDYKLDTVRALETGTLPEGYLAKDPALRRQLIRSYAGIYLKEEIMAESLTRNLQGFTRFLGQAALSSGTILDYSKIAQRAKISRQTAVRFFEILEDTLITTRITPFFDAGGADLVKHPRHYFFDTGVLNALMANFTVSADRIGILFEHLLFNQIKGAAQALDQDFSAHSFRTRSGSEVDFVFKIGGEVWAIEAKASASVHDSDLRGLKNFKTYFPQKHHAAIATLSRAEKKIEGIWILPWQKLMKEMGL